MSRFRHSHCVEDFSMMSLKGPGWPISSAALTRDHFCVHDYSRSTSRPAGGEERVQGEDALTSVPLHRPTWPHSHAHCLSALETQRSFPASARQEGRGEADRAHSGHQETNSVIPQSTPLPKEAGLLKELGWAGWRDSSLRRLATTFLTASSQDPARFVCRSPLFLPPGQTNCRDLRGPGSAWVPTS